MKELGYYYSYDKFEGGYHQVKNKTCKPYPIKIYNFGHFKLLNFLLEKTKNNLFERQIVYHELISIHYYFNLVTTTNNYYRYVYEIFDILINCTYLYKSQKERLIDMKTKIEKKEKGIK